VTEVVHLCAFLMPLQQIILNQILFSFLAEEGTKEVFFDSSALSNDNSSFLLMKAGHCLMKKTLNCS
jgi:hypothetical protein